MKTLSGLVELALGAPAGYVGYRVIRHEPEPPKRCPDSQYSLFRRKVLSLTKPFTSADLIDFAGFDANCARVYLVRMARAGEITDTNERRKSSTGNSKRLIVYKVSEITAPCTGPSNGNIPISQAQAK